VRHCDCDMHDRRASDALVPNTDCQPSPPPPPTTHTQHRSPTAITHACTQRSETHKHEQSTADTVPRSVVHSHSSHSERRGAATHTRRHKSAIAILRHSTLLTALDTAPAMHAQDAHSTVHRAYDGTQLRAPHTPPTENHTQSHAQPPHHTHQRAVRLPSVDGMLPESWLPPKSKYLQDTRTAIASHHGTRRRRRPS
jgi:hypothetical protein